MWKTIARKHSGARTWHRKIFRSLRRTSHTFCCTNSHWCAWTSPPVNLLNGTRQKVQRDWKTAPCHCYRLASLPIFVIAFFLLWMTRVTQGGALSCRVSSTSCHGAPLDAVYIMLSSMFGQVLNPALLIFMTFMQKCLGKESKIMTTEIIVPLIVWGSGAVIGCIWTVVVSQM